MNLLHPCCQYIQQHDIEKQANICLHEDIGNGDLSAQLLPSQLASAHIVVNETAVICGIAWANACFMQKDPKATIHWHVRDGDKIRANDSIATIHANTRALVSSERSALNFLQFLSGISTYTSALVAMLQGTGCTLLDTRKTIPGLRLAQKYAVLVGGGTNHRLGLYDEFLLKENHLSQSRSIAAAIDKARCIHTNAKIVVEVENFDELQQAVAAKPDRILLDNFSLPDIARAVNFVQGNIPLEASGGIDTHNLRDLAQTGITYLSVGSITKNIQAIDFSMRLTNAKHTKDN